jgi:hypothetical protein
MPIIGAPFAARNAAVISAVRDAEPQQMCPTAKPLG